MFVKWFSGSLLISEYCKRHRLVRIRTRSHFQVRNWNNKDDDSTFKHCELNPNFFFWSDPDPFSIRSDPIQARNHSPMSGAASALFLLDIKGRVLIWRDYRGDVSAVEAERFFTKLIEKEVHSTSSLSIISSIFQWLLLLC